MIKKILTLIFTTIIVASAIFFILKKPTADNEVVFWTLQMSDFAPYINGVIDDFEKENPNIKIKWVDVPFSEGEKRTLASVLSDNPPDLVNLNPDFSATLAHKGALQEIQKSELSQFNEEILKALETDGKMFSIPWYATSAITIYNKDLLSSVPKTYEQMANIAPDIRKKGAYITLPNITENDTMLKILNKYNCSLSKGEGANVGKQSEPYNGGRGLNSEQCTKIFALFKNLYSKDTTYDMIMASREMADHYHKYFIKIVGRIRNLNYSSDPVKKAVLSYLDGYDKRKAQMEYTLFPCQDNPTDDCAYGRIFSYRYALGMMEFDRTELLTYRMILNYMYDKSYFTKEEIEKIFEE